MKQIVTIPAILLFACFSIAAEEAESVAREPFAVSGWKYVRMRKGRGGESNVVTISFKLKNLTGQKLERVALDLDLREAMGIQAGRMKAQAIRYMKPDEEVDVEITAAWVPVFSTYFLNCRYRVERQNCEASYLGVSPWDKPLFVPPKPEGRNVRLLVMGYELSSDPKTGQGLLSVKVKNFGGLPARRPQIRLRVYSSDRKLLGQLQADLRPPKLPKDKIEAVPPGEERKYMLVMFGVPNYDMYDVFVTHDAPWPEESLPGDKFTDARDIEIIVTSAKVEKRELVVGCKARNGLAKPVAKLDVDFWLVNHETVKDEDGRETVEKRPVEVARTKVATGLALEPGDMKDFTFRMPVPVKRFEDYGYQLAYEEPGSEVSAGEGKGTQKLGEVSFEVTGGERLKEGGVRLEGFVRQTGGESEVQVSVAFIFKDEAGKEVARKTLNMTVPQDGRKFFNETYGDVTAFADYTVELGEIVPQAPQK
ncbi:MAG: hypothetical protein JW909_09490 [Planctomycetes bacterium]|nr:hypothetical protein [Planctomycetota bacterium]